MYFTCINMFLAIVIPAGFAAKPKIIIFALQGRLVGPIHVKFGTWVRLAVQNFTRQLVPGVGTWSPKWQQFPLFDFDRFL